MYNDNKHMVCLCEDFRDSLEEGDSHVNDAGNVTPASDVS
jgi:hypothetical protein